MTVYVVFGSFAMQPTPPEYYICPILQQIMEDPVILDDGHTYERAAILKWLSKKNVSPITRQTIKNRNLIPNRVLKASIAAWKNAILESRTKNGSIKPTFGKRKIFSKRNLRTAKRRREGVEDTALENFPHTDLRDSNYESSIAEV